MHETYKAYLYVGDRTMHLGESPQALMSVDDARQQGMSVSIQPTGVKPDYFEIKDSKGEIKERWALSDGNWKQAHA